MGSALLWLAVIVVLAGAAILWSATPWPKLLFFYYQLYQAQRAGNRFYAECPTVSKNIVHAPGMPKLDVYRPETGSGHPVIIYVYGGSWSGGRKELYAPAAQRLLPAGFVLVVPDYTLHPAAGYPRQTEEIASAIAWTLDHVAEYGGDPRRVVLVAQSAGAQISGLALLEPRWLAAHGHRLAELRGFVGISGVYDFEALLLFHAANPRAHQLILNVLGGAVNARAASPITYVAAGMPPVLLIHGDADQTVPASATAAFYERLRAAGVPSEMVIYPGAHHADILFRAMTEQPPRLFNDIIGFTRRCTADSGQVAAISSAQPSESLASPAPFAT
jgi:acetyl esterase/lipase